MTRLTIADLPEMPPEITRDGGYRVYKGDKYTAYDDGNSAETAYYRDEAFALRARLALALQTLDESRIALNDWMLTYAPECCDFQSVAEAHARIQDAGGTLGYIANEMANCRAIIDACKVPE